jgi:peptidoglycan/xylan/chitin deacetylase (PgdA/CDA1 family)
MDRRHFLLVLAAGLVGAAAGHGAVALGEEPAAAAPRAGGPRRARPVAVGQPVAAVPGVLPAPTGVVSALPGAGSSVALTVDDGVSSAVVSAFVAFARHTGVRLTFFPNGCYRSWADSAAELRPMIEAGQGAVGNHTFSHPDVTTLGDAALVDEIRRNQDFLRTTLGVRETPFFRPPYGRHDARTDRIAADLGHPTIALWNGTLGDDRLITADQLMAAARQYLLAQRIVIGHANHPTVTTVYAQLLDLLAERGLRTVTLADVWSGRSGR